MLQLEPRRYGRSCKALGLECCVEHWSNVCHAILPRSRHFPYLTARYVRAGPQQKSRGCNVHTRSAGGHAWPRPKRLTPTCSPSGMARAATPGWLGRSTPNFAAQAVIAIENARLLNELRQRTDDLSEALEQQTATSEVLRVISSSPGELEPVFQAMLANALRICEAEFGTLYRFDGEAFHLAAQVGTPPELAEFQRRRGPFQPLPGSHLDRVVLTKQVSHAADIVAEAIPGPATMLGRARSYIAVPMLKDDELIGAFAIYRQEVRPFTEKQIELVKNFAAQAVIAIENTRLLNELRESLEQQTATSEVLRVISSSPGELEPVFRAMLENATRICEAKFGVLNLNEDGSVRMAAMHDVPAPFADFLQNQPGAYQPLAGSLLERVIRTKQICHVADNAAEATGRAATLGGARSCVCVPMLRDDSLIGVITIYRQEVRPFTDKQIALVQNFANQAVIAIENTRLLNELRESLERQTATSEVLSVISRSPGELEPVFQSMLHNAVRICEARFGSLFRFDGNAFHLAATVGAPPELVEVQRQRVPIGPTPGGLLDRTMRTKQISHTADARADTVVGLAAKFGGA